MHFKVQILLGKLFQQVPPLSSQTGDCYILDNTELKHPTWVIDHIYAAMLKPTSLRSLVCYIDVTPLQCVGVVLILTKLSEIYRNLEKMKGFAR